MAVIMNKIRIMQGYILFPINYAISTKLIKPFIADDLLAFSSYSGYI